MKFRKNYIFQRDNDKKEEQIKIEKGRLIIGVLYIFFGIGFLFNFLAYFLVVLLKALPDNIIIYLVSESFDNSLMKNQIYGNQLSLVQYIIELGSLISVISLFSSIYLIYDNSGKDQGKKIGFVFLSLLGCILFGFSSCFSLFLLH